MRTHHLLLSTALLLTSCGKAGLAEDCTETADCAENTQCIPYGAFTGEGGGEPTCVAEKRICSLPCRTDSDCASLGTGHICLTDCYEGSCVKGTRGG